MINTFSIQYFLHARNIMKSIIWDTYTLQKYKPTLLNIIPRDTTMNWVSMQTYQQRIRYKGELKCKYFSNVFVYLWLKSSL